jgi:hypothetical protein
MSFLILILVSIAVGMYTIWWFMRIWLGLMNAGDIIISLVLPALVSLWFGVYAFLHVFKRSKFLHGGKKPDESKPQETIAHEPSTIARNL